MTAKLVELFRRYATPPSPLHEAVQRAARQAGWIPPWEFKQKGSKAGKISGIKRGLRTEWRKTIVQEAYRRLKPQHQVNPYADESKLALMDKYRWLVNEGCKGNRLAPPADDFISLLPGLLSALSSADQQALKNIGREALIKDMKALKIRSKRPKKRVG
jgi:hypothetical protein